MRSLSGILAITKGIGRMRKYTLATSNLLDSAHIPVQPRPEIFSPLDRLVEPGDVMQDIEFVKKLLESDYRTHRPKEYPYPDLEQLIARTNFDFPTGVVEGSQDNGAYNRDEIGYQYFPDSNKRIRRTCMKGRRGTTAEPSCHS